MRTIEPFRLKTTIDIDNAKGRAALQTVEKDTDRVGQRFVKLGKEVTTAMKGTEAGARFGRDFGSSAVSSINGSIQSLGQTIGGLVGTALAPGIGTAIGSTIGSAVDSTLGKISGPLMETIRQGIELNKELERTTVEFKTFAGSELEAKKYLGDLKNLAIDSGTDFRFLLDASEHTFDLTNNLKLTNTILRAATDQAADFGGKAETIEKVAEALGLVAEKGELSSRELMKLYKLGIDAKKYLSMATGVGEKTIERMMAQGRLRGDVAARLIAEGIEREKGGFAAKIASTTTYGAEAQAGVREQLLGARGTEKVTAGLGDYYRLKNQILGSSQAETAAAFIDKSAGQLINLVERGVKGGFELTRGIAEGVMTGDAQALLKSSFNSLGGFVESTLKSVFGIESPSKLTLEKVGIPIGEGIGVGTGIGMMGYAQDHADDDVKRFIALYADAARKAMAETGVPASVTIAQAILESGTGKSGLTRRAKNFFGIKGSGPAGSVTMRTREVGPGGSYFMNSPFRAYNTADESFADHARFLLGHRYRGALQNAGDPKQYARDIARAGYATDPLYAQKIGSTIDKYGLGKLDTMVGGAPVTSTNPMPVSIVTGSGRGVLAAAGYNSSVLDFLYGTQSQAKTSTSQGQTVNAGDLGTAVVNINKGAADLLVTSTEILGVSALTFRPIEQQKYNAELAAQAIDAVAVATRAEFEATKQYQDAAKRELFMAVDIKTQLSGMISQVAGLLPQQEVGKKRGFFSKLLGIAAPFLSFIPGVGPLLSQVVGMASNAIGGNWSGVASGISGGFASGGVFRSTSGPKPGLTGAYSRGFGGAFASGGRVRRGTPILVGDGGRPEVFVPPADGYIHPDARSFAGGGGDSPALLEMLARVHAVLSGLESVPPGHIVRQGARGMLEAMDGNADIGREWGRRMRIA